jgi:hypothetical protein
MPELRLHKNASMQSPRHSIYHLYLQHLCRTIHLDLSEFHHANSEFLQSIHDQSVGRLRPAELNRKTLVFYKKEKPSLAHSHSATH